MRLQKIGISVLFLYSSVLVFGQKTKSDSVKSEKKIEGVILQGSTKKSNADNLINLQKKSIGITENVGSDQLQKQGVSDVSTALTKASGTQKQESTGAIFVRGLGDRYNETTLNGLPIPSDDPENKNIDLAIFKTSMVEYLSLDKVYSPTFLGDFGGANINIVSKEFSGKPYIKIGLGSGINLQTFDKKDFKLQNGGPGFFGYKVSTFKSNVDPQVTYPFTTSWNFKDAKNPFNSNFNLEAGKSFTFKNGKKLSVFAYGGFDNDYIYSQGKEGFFDSTGAFIKELDKVERYTYSTNTTGLFNATLKLNSNNKISYTSNFIHTSVQDARFYTGKLREIGSQNQIYIARNDNKISNLWINQLFGNHKISDTWTADWALGYNMLDTKRPDRLQNTFDITDPTSPKLLTGSIIQNHRYYDDLKENTILGFVHLTKTLNQFKINFGYDGQLKKRDFNYTTIGLQLNFVPSFIDVNNVDGIFNPANNSSIIYNTLRGYGHGVFDPFFYNFKQIIHSSFLNVDYKISDRLTAQIGGRYDYINIDNTWDSSELGAGVKVTRYNKFLPALNVKYEVSDKQNLRFAASKTYTLPQPKELVPIAYYDVTNNTYGNPKVYPSDNYNADLKWEYFPKRGEVLSVTAFGKYIKNPIARTTYSSASSSDMTYFNIADYGTIFGAEVEIRKDIYDWGKTRLYTFLNGSYMNTNQKLNADKVARENGKSIEFSGQTSEKIQGASDFLANVNLGLNHKFGAKKDFDFVVSYAYVGRSLYSIGTNNTGNFYQKPINVLDATLNINLDGIGIGIFAKNLLNPNYIITQENKAGIFTNRDYTRGRELGFNISYKF
ncbi:Outer membrane receptor proteins, mostly Fe transport [Halpernia humi]|uniref:Outer membrane receptor proteins, mostly Fe transport n=1 Tax=Halpernia humi TaxID=493375 RepID=A0A1H5YQP0_9FLAO|nr:TonB-dependent receptor [Halpernia humi]SEG26314.1 Outer membrane receptor proteins, mostly Fe transport [Halpernia humi]